MEAERQHKNLLIPVLNFNHWNPAEFSAQPAEPVEITQVQTTVSLSPASHQCVVPYQPGPIESLSQKKLHHAIYTSLNARDPAACAAIQTFFAAVEENVSPTTMVQLVIVFASLSQLAETALFPSQRCNPSISKSGCHH